MIYFQVSRGHECHLTGIIMCVGRSVSQSSAKNSANHKMNPTLKKEQEKFLILLHVSQDNLFLMVKDWLHST